MTTRLYFLTPSEVIASKVSNGLREKGIKESHIRAVAHREHYPLRDDIPEAGFIEATDTKHAAKKGAVTGGGLGLLGGIAIAAMNPAGLIYAGAEIAALTAAGAATGSWLSTMVGVSVTNSEFKAYDDAIGNGQILMVVDVQDGQVEPISNEIRLIHPTVEIRIGKAA